MTGKSFLAALLFSLATLAKLTAQCDCVTTGNCPVPINDNGIYNGYLDVTVNGPNDLAQSPLSQVCVTLTHTWIGDLSISLTSPSGVEYLIMADVGNNYGECGTQQDNAEICIVPGTNNPLTNNTDYQCNSAPCSVGICCLNGNWTVPCGGVTSPITGAIQAPNCDLNDFNVPGQPANGTWTISVLDVCNMDVGNLENFSLTFAGGQACYACEADGGVLDSIEITTCVGDTSLILDLPPNYPNGPLFGGDSAIYDYTYAIVQGNIVIAQQANPNLTNLPPGSYVVYGLSYLITHTGQVPSLIGMNINDVIALLTSSTAPFCADLSDNGVPVTILPPLPPTPLTETVCFGDCVTVGTQQFCTSGSYSVVLNSFNGCDSTVNLNLTVVQPDTVDYVATVCTGGCVTVGGQSYCAPAQHYIQLQNWQGCDSVVHLTFNVHSPTATITPAMPPSITCLVSSVTLSAASSGPGALTYSWAGPAGFAGSNQASITATIPGIYTVTVSDNAVTPACTAMASVNVPDGRVWPALVFNGSPSICQGDTIDLSALAISDTNNSGATLTFHLGSPATPANQLPNGLVWPSSNTVYTCQATIGNCTDEIQVPVSVNPVPTGTFTVAGPSCITNGSIVTYTGNAGAGANFNWNFGGGIATPGTGPGPHTVMFSSAGTKTISLSVTENGCTSSIATQTTVVDDALATPVINCASTTNSITFSWNAVPNSTGYTVSSSVTGTQPTPTSYQITGLTPGQQVTLTVVANGATACGSTSATQTCTAQTCPPNLAVAITPVPNICTDANTMPFNLQATASGGNGSGSFTFSGPGITNASLGTFNPSQAGLGANTINVTYTENGCPASSSTIINVFPTPNVSITATSPVCQTGSGSTVVVSNPVPGMNYTWDFDGGFAAPGFGPGPHSVTWGTSGTKIITVTGDDGSGCPSPLATATVVVDNPLPPLTLTCSSTTDSVTVSWSAVNGAAGYTVQVTTGQVATQISPTSYTVSGLFPNDQVSFTVTALGTNACGDRVATTTCTAMDCPPVLLTIDPVADICLDASSLPVQVQHHIGGGTPSGVVEFFGPGVSLSGLFDPNQANIGANLITATYTDGPCSRSVDLTINVYPTPTGDFTAPASVCQGSDALVSLVGAAQAGLSYVWDFDGGSATPGTGAGPHTVTWSTPGQKFITLTVESPEGCMSPIYAKMVDVSAPVAAPQPSCINATTTSIEFTWQSVPGASGYTFTPTTGQVATQTGPTTWQVLGLQPQEQVCVTVTSGASGSACTGATAQLCCNALPCPIITVDATPLADICLGSTPTPPIQLVVTVTGGNGTGTGIWSGPGILNGSTGTFSPSAAGFGLHTLVYNYVQDACTFSDSITVGVYQQPTSIFSMDTAICLSEVATVSFQGASSSSAIYTWDFGGGVAVPGTGIGPHQLSWGTAGTYTVSLSVTDGSCASTVFTQNIQVDDQLAEPSIVCFATTDGVVFTWNTVPNATSYDAVGTGGQQTSDTSYVFTGLDPEQPVSLQLTVNGNSSCPLPVVTAQCSALPCPQLTVTVEPVTPICLTANTSTVQLVGDVDGVGIAGGTKTWSGPGVVDAAQGIFDPAVAGVGLHAITCLYAQGNCSYEDSEFISIVAPPVADAGPDRLITCWESDQSVQLGGPLTTSSNNIAYLWSATSGSFPGVANTRTTEVAEEGLFTLTVTNTALGCSDSDDVLVMSTQSSPEPSVEIEPINCGYDGKDANMTVSSVVGGVEPYLYSLNGEPFVTSNTFGYLEAGDYTLAVMDAEGCMGDTVFTVKETGSVDVDLTANIVGQAVVKYGESITLTAISSLSESELDSINWTGGSYLSCTDCLDPVATPLEQTTFTVTLFKGNCLASDSLTIFVDSDEGGVYVPTAFSPNGDGVNDQFMVYAGPTVTRIKSFLVFDRWGEMVYEYSDFDPKDPARGWNGHLDGQPMNPAVYVWFAEVEFVDGSVQLLEGDVTLVR